MILKTIEILASLVESLICFWFITTFLNAEKKKSIWAIPAILIYFGLTLVGDNFLPGFNVAVTVVLMAVSIIYALLICNRHYIKAIVACSIYKTIVILVGSTLFSVLSMIINNIDVLMQGANSSIRIVSIVINKVIIISLLAVIVAIFKRGSITDKITGVVVFFISLLTIYGMGSVMVILASDLEKNSVGCLSLILVFILVNVAVYFLVNQVRKLEKQKYELKLLNDRYELQQDKYTESMGVWNNVRKIQHDIKHHLCVIKRQLDDGEIDDCKEYIGELIPGTEQMGKIIKSDNTVLDYLINSKLCALENTQVIISGVVGDLSDISDKDLVSIFGNIIDNAIDAISGLEEKRIELLFSRHDENRLIVCKNTIAHSVLEKNRELRSTKPDRDSHGLGHVIVEEVVTRLGGMIDYSESGDMFSVQIILPMNPK